MSAENALRMFRMFNGQFWISVVRCGDTVIERQGAGHVLARCASYDEANERLRQMSDDESPEFVPTEYGIERSEPLQLLAQPAHFLASRVEVHFGGRECDCVDYRDLQRKLWEVREIDEASVYGLTRQLGRRLWYAQALTLAHSYATAEPGDCRVECPRWFREFQDYRRHSWRRRDCFGDGERLCLPKQF